MTISRTQLMIFIIALILCGGLVARAYTNPSGSTPTNIDEPIDESISDQVKDGGLSVGALSVTGNALLKQQVIFGAAIYGSGSPEVLHFGDGTTAVSVTINKNLKQAKWLQADSLKTTSGTEELCADQNGVITTIC